MMTTKRTCGPLHFESRAANIDETSRTEIRAFAAGFATGLAEKVHLGACRAAMMRPDEEDFNWLWERVERVARIYGLLLRINTYPDPGRSREIWLLRSHADLDDFRAMRAAVPNSPEWHALRGRLCGIPENEIDVRFHERRGAVGERGNARG